MTFSWLRKSAIVFATLLALVVAIGVGGFAWLRTSLPHTSGTVTLPGLDAPVTVIRNSNGVPRIIAQSEQDAYFALGYVHAQDRLWQMELTRRAGAGRLAEVLGEKTTDMDRFIRTLGIYRSAEAIYENSPPEVKRALDAYAAGVNAWLSTRQRPLPPEFILLRYQPEEWRPADSLVWSRLMALRLGRNRKNEELRACMALNGVKSSLIDELWPEDPPGTPVTVARRQIETLFARRERQLAEVRYADLTDDSGSNGWILHGQLTNTGKPILANDPHLSFSAPIVWYLARIEVPGLTLTGATAPGVPFTVLGHNGSIAWGMTNAGGDVEDLFIETPDPNDPNKYLTHEGPRAFETREETIHVKGSEDVIMTVRMTHHGPVISDVSNKCAELASTSQVVALSTPVLRPDDRTVEALYAINRAQNWKQFRAAANNFHTPHANLFFAGIDGDIGFVSAGRIPIRKSGDGRNPVAGADGAHDWVGFIPAAEFPEKYNPQTGRIINANNRVVGDNYPYLLTRDWALPYRAVRITEVLKGQVQHSLADSQTLQLDVVSEAARKVVPLMLRVTPSDDHAATAVRLLASWNFKMDRDRPEPLIYATWLRHLVIALARDELGEQLMVDYMGLIFRPAPRFAEMALSDQHHWCDDTRTGRVETCQDQLSTSLNRALDELSNSLGSDIEKWQWGTLHQATFIHRVLTNVPIISNWADLRIATDGCDHTLNRGSTARGEVANPFEHIGGTGYRAVYDLSNLDNSVFMIPTGQSGNFLSRHYSDMFHRWRDGQYIRITGIRNSQEKPGGATLRLVPTGAN